MNVNCDVGLDFVVVSCCRRLIFSWPDGVASFSALAIALEMIPEFSPVMPRYKVSN